MSELELGFVLCWRGAGVRAGVGLHRRYLFRRERVSAPAFAVATFESCLVAPPFRIPTLPYGCHVL